MAKITSLFNLDISQIRHDGTEVKLIKLNGDVIYRKTSQSYGIYVPYQFRDDLEITEVDVIVNESHTDLSYMFCDCENLTYANAEDWDTSNVTNMSYMFFHCYDLEELDISNWDTSNVTNMSCMFDGSNLGILDLDLSNFNTGNVINMSYMFAYNNPITDYGTPIRLEKLDVSSFDTSRVTNMEGMFSYNYVRSLDLSNFRTSNVYNMARMFSGCTELLSLNLSNFKIYSDTTINWMFQGCDSLRYLRLNNCDNKTIKKIVGSLDFPTGTVSGLSRNLYCQEKNAEGITLPDGWRFEFVEEEPEIPEEPDVPDIPDVPEEPEIPEGPIYTKGEYRGDTIITEVNTVVNKTHTDLSSMFYGCTSLASVNTQNWDTSNVTTMNRMFYNCKSLTSLDLSNWDTSKVTDMYWMFFGCSSLIELNMSNFDTSNVKYVTYLLSSCTSLRTLRLDNCSNTTISKIIDSSGFPTNTIDGAIKLIHCKRAEAEGLLAPTSWQFYYID